MQASHASVRFAPLADFPAAVPLLARWYFDQWGHERPGATLEASVAKVNATAQTSALPTSLLAIADGKVVGAAQVKFHEMDIYPDKEHWLGNVYVVSSHRGIGIATQLVERIVVVSRQFGVKTLHLQTEALGGGLYARLGWQPEERVRYSGKLVLVMRRDLLRSEDCITAHGVDA